MFKTVLEASIALRCKYSSVPAANLLSAILFLAQMRKQWATQHPRSIPVSLSVWISYCIPLFLRAQWLAKVYIKSADGVPDLGCWSLTSSWILMRLQEGQVYFAFPFPTFVFFFNVFFFILTFWLSWRNRLWGKSTAPMVFQSIWNFCHEVQI